MGVDTQFPEDVRSTSVNSKFEPPGGNVALDETVLNSLLVSPHFCHYVSGELSVFAGLKYYNSLLQYFTEHLWYSK